MTLRWSRRRFLEALGLAGAAAAADTTLPAWLRAGEESARPPYRLLADMHVHASLNDWNRRTPFATQYALTGGLAAAFNPTHAEWEPMHEAGIDLVCNPHYNVFDEVVSLPTDPAVRAPYNTHRMMDLLETELRSNSAPHARLARNHIELKTLLETDKTSDAFRVAVVHALEGGHSLGGDLGELDALARRGIAYITITHFFYKGVSSAANALPFFADAGQRSPRTGLTGFGRDLVRQMEDLGVIVDATHMTARAFEDLFKTARRPLLASHASVRALADHPYCLHDEHIVEIARRGGLIAVILMPFFLSNYSGSIEAAAKGSLADVVRVIRHAVKVCGTHEHVAIGSDFGAFINGPQGMSRVSQAGILREALLEEFSDTGVVEDIMANNGIRFLLENWRSGV